MKELLVDFGLPAFLLLICFVLLLTGIDGEVKSILTLSAGWMFRSGIVRKRA